MGRRGDIRRGACLDRVVLRAARGRQAAGDRSDQARRLSPGERRLRAQMVHGLPLDDHAGAAAALFATLYLPPLLRLLGARIGDRTEISTVVQIPPTCSALATRRFSPTVR